jgi:hypothetical protein
MDLMILHQDRPTWIVAIDPDTIEEVAIGPFYSEAQLRGKASRLHGRGCSHATEARITTKRLRKSP